MISQEIILQVKIKIITHNFYNYNKQHPNIKLYYFIFAVVVYQTHSKTMGSIISINEDTNDLLKNLTLSYKLNRLVHSVEIP